MSNNPFVVDQLTPQNQSGQSTQTYQLTKSSVSPVRHTGRDARGFPIEDTVPTSAKWEFWLMADGCINKVPLRTGSVPSNHTDAIAYENETVYDLVVSGAIPVRLCPYSTKFQHLTGGGPFASPPPGVTDCGGSASEHGCVHLQEIAKARREEVLRIYNLDAEAFKSNAKEEHRRMLEGIVDGVGAALAKHAAPAASATAQRANAAQRLRDGKGEVEG